ncbi:MAG TPA: hypothetical protein VGS80_23905, partial [Ktedonobacterales bacterium]|nr:hypothetical protein [Ktedonobacterales bacterium]
MCVRTLKLFWTYAPHRRRALQRAMQLDFQQAPQLRRHMQMPVVRVEPDIAAGRVLPELDGVPAVRGL